MLECVEKSMYFCEYMSFESILKDYSKWNFYEVREIIIVVKMFCEKGKVDLLKIIVFCVYWG